MFTSCRCHNKLPHLSDSHNTSVVPDSSGWQRSGMSLPRPSPRVFRLTFTAVASAQDPFLCVYGSQRPSSCFFASSSSASSNLEASKGGLSPSHVTSLPPWLQSPSLFHLPRPCDSAGPLGNAGSAPYFKGS